MKEYFRAGAVSKITTKVITIGGDDYPANTLTLKCQPIQTALLDIGDVSEVSGDVVISYIYDSQGFPKEVKETCHFEKWPLDSFDGSHCWLFDGPEWFIKELRKACEVHTFEA